MTSKYTNEEKKLLRQTVETGRKEGKTNEQIADSMVSNDIFPGRTKTSLMVKISKFAPLRRYKKKRVRVSLKADYERIDRLIQQRKGLMKQMENEQKKVRRIEERLKALLK